MKSTNELLQDTIDTVSILIGYARADVEHSLENGAVEQAKDDFNRKELLIKARGILLQCKKD